MRHGKFLTIALNAAQKAESVIMKHFLKDGELMIKEDLSPVSIADKEAENIIKSTIKDEFPEHSFLGEESGGIADVSGFLWIVDPIDGTKNYSRGLPIFATQIALMKGGDLIVGVSNAPVLKEMVYAEKGGGTFFNKKRVNVSSINALDEAYMSFGGLKYFERQKLVDNLLSLVRATRGHRGIGDFWSYHMLAQGKIDIMIEAETKIWDIAAVKVIVEEAGGKITDINGNVVGKDTTSIIATNSLLHDAIQDYFRR
ncbi:MAG: inositol monophosphatase family protein [Candidatus Woesearchaeota archaeon]